MTNGKWHDTHGAWREWLLIPVAILIMGLWYLFWAPIVFICVLVEKLGWSKG